MLLDRYCRSPHQLARIMSDQLLARFQYLQLTLQNSTQLCLGYCSRSSLMNCLCCLIRKSIIVGTTSTISGFTWCSLRIELSDRPKFSNCSCSNFPGFNGTTMFPGANSPFNEMLSSLPGRSIITRSYSLPKSFSKKLTAASNTDLPLEHLPGSDLHQSTRNQRELNPALHSSQIPFGWRRPEYSPE